MFINIKKACALILCVGVGVNFSIISSLQSNLDLNKDGVINVLDVQFLVKIISNGKVPSENLPDLNNDGKTDIKDLQILLNNLGKKVVSKGISIDYFYSSLNLANLFREKVIKNTDSQSNIVPISKEFYSYLERKDCFCRKVDWLFSCFIPMGKVKGSFNLAFHISPVSPPLV